MSQVLQLEQGLRFSAGERQWQLDPLSIAAGQWVVLAPAGGGPEHASALA